MGIITDFFVATREQVATLTPSDLPRDHFPTFECKGIDPVKLATLQTILSGGNVTDPEAVVALIPEPVLELSEGSVTILPLAEEVVRGLASLDEAAAARVGESWLNTEEFQLDGWTTDEFLPWFREFRTFMKNALAPDKNVFVWICV